ncbi:DUF4380 domain-containing protein [Edaphobacter flagellatus]|uniref:DUF4380 domain-containing protein n=1 Tax=Edaphobacter flagellatus TaxID=1933044 RepID=UPI0021B42924|nr:DUF4380 domain-containing protein [Edaphobacter flagellatus]
MKSFALLLTLMFSNAVFYARASPATCSVHAVSYQGWDAQEVDNPWLKLTFVPQLGGRLMQVEFNGHPYLFVNPRYRGQYIPPEQAKGGWINYGGDKIWPMPEGDTDDHHWVLASTAIDDLPYEFKLISQGERCSIQLTGQPDTITGLQYIRTISISADSPQIDFHAVMRNAATHPIEWSVQSVSQYDLSDSAKPADYNHQFWAYTPVNPNSTYPDGYHVRSGLADDPSFSVADGLFRLRWLYFDNEVWLDSRAGWLAVVDQQSKYGMIERFHYDASGNYPGKATVIFYKSGPSVRFDKEGQASIRATTPERTPYYMEAEINSPIVKLAPNQTYAMDTTWNPLHIDAALQTVTDAGVATQRLALAHKADSTTLTGTFAAFYPGNVIAVFTDRRGKEVGHHTLRQVKPDESITLNEPITVPAKAEHVALRLFSAKGADLGLLDQADIGAQAP